MKNMKLIATGQYLPKQRITNEVLEKELNLTKGYIAKRSGIQTRYYAEEKMLDMAIQAAQDAFLKSKLAKEQIGLLIVATTSTSQLMPGISYQIQKALQFEHCICFDLLAGCSGYINALDLAYQYICLGKIKYALLVGVDKLSDLVNTEDIATKILLADGARSNHCRSLRRKNNICIVNRK